MKINRLLLVNCLSSSPSTEYFCFRISKNKINFFFFTPNLIIFENEINTEVSDDIINEVSDDIINEEDIYINFSDFYSFVNLSEEQYIIVDLQKDHINLISGCTKIQLSFLNKPEKDYKTKFEEESTIYIPYTIFSENINAHQRIIKKSPDLYSSLLLLIKEKEIQFQSTDIYRILSTSYIYDNNNRETLISFPKIVTSFFFKNLKNFLLEEKIIIKRDKNKSNYLNIELDNKTKLYFFEGNKVFSNFEDIKNKFFYKKYIEINKKDIIKYLREVEVVSKDNFNIKYLASIDIKENNTEITSSNEKNRIICNLNTKNEIDKEIKININTNSTSEIIKLFPDEDIRIFFQDAQSPLFIKGNNGFEAIISVLSEF